jgi:hypothetical protein
MAARYKHPSFSSEREWRLVVTRNAVDDNGGVYGECYRPDSNYLIPYVSVKLNGRLPEFIPSVCAGPKRYRMLAVAGLKGFLAQSDLLSSGEGCGIVVRASEIPFRSFK